MKEDYASPLLWILLLRSGFSGGRVGVQWCAGIGPGDGRGRPAWRETKKEKRTKTQVPTDPKVCQSSGFIISENKILSTITRE